MKDISSRYVLSLVFAAMLLGLSSLAAAAYHGVKGTAGTRGVRQSRMSYTNGRKVVFVYIGAESCGFSLKPGFDKTIRQIQSLVSQQSRKRGEPFSSLGVSAGLSPELGAKYLERFGPFDEIASGNSLLNSYAIRFFFDDLPGEASLPQVLVVERDLQALDPGYLYRNERVLIRAIGVPQIEQWAADGAPVW